VMEEIENDEEASKRYIETRSRDTVWRFGLFADALSRKYKNEFWDGFGYYDDRNGLGNRYIPMNMPDKIERYNSSNLLRLITDSLNQLFSETAKFLIETLSGYNFKWQTFFESVYPIIDEQLRAFSEKDRSVRDYIADINHIHHHRKDHEENREMYRRITELLRNADNLYTTFADQLKQKFNEQLSHNTVAMSDSIIDEIDKCYVNEGWSIPAYEPAESPIIQIEAPEVFIDYKRYAE